MCVSSPFVKIYLTEVFVYSAIQLFTNTREVQTYEDKDCSGIQIEDGGSRLSKDLLGMIVRSFLMIGHGCCSKPSS